MELSDEEAHRLRGYALLSGKPLLLVANLGEDEIREAAAFSRSARASPAFARKPRVALCAVSAPIEAEMADLSPEDAEAFREDLGLAEPGTRAGDPLDLRPARAHLVPHRGRGRVPGLDHPPRDARRVAAGTIHSDIERGFIRAQVVAFDDLVAAGSIAACRERGTLAARGQATTR